MRALLGVVHELDAIALVLKGGAVGADSPGPSAIFALSLGRRNVVT